MAKILVVDDEITSITILKKVLEDAGHRVTTVSDGAKALEKIKEFKYDILLTDFNMPGMNGVELTEQAVKIEPDMIVILITAFATIRSAVDAIRYGAFDYLTKPVNKEELLLAIDRGMERVSLVHENLLLKHKLEKVETGEADEDYATVNKEIKTMLSEAVKVAKTDSTVLITGANGTGKEVLAKLIHKNSLRKDQQFVVLNCAAIPTQLLESELFGHVKGSFTGAIKDHKGYFEIADNGTIFLDEIAEIDIMLQVKLLRVLQEREFSKVGDTRTQTTNVRIIAATNQDLKKMIAEGKFREDLYYRLNVFEFHLLSLKERTEDIEFYFERFLKEFSITNKKKAPAIDKSVRDFLLSYSWPGNIRELKNVAERVSILCENNKITSDLLPINIIGVNQNKTYSEDYNENKENTIREFEITFITKHLKIHKGNVAATAKAINFHPVSLRQKIAKLGIDPRDYKY
ncbi:MAG: sigma-54-dependent Fis family transcriptional regulator [Ignavibacteriae bacterium]|nr:sigma-54-dependent Fis family transcriptional regulator [Ignavibacteriota bacterium]